MIAKPSESPLMASNLEGRHQHIKPMNILSYSQSLLVLHLAPEGKASCMSQENDLPTILGLAQDPPTPRSPRTQVVYSPASSLPKHIY